MITKTEWQAIHRQLMADERERSGEPPTAEEILAYTRGELSPEEEESVRDRLVSYPELVRTLTAEFPAEDPLPNEAGYVSDEEMAAEWEAIQRRIESAGPREARVLRFWRAMSALAAVLALLFGGLLWKMRSAIDHPRVLEEQVLDASAQRGPADQFQLLTAKGEDVLLVIPIIGANADAWRLEIADVSSNRPRVRWSSGMLQRRGDSFTIIVPMRFLTPGKYHVVLYDNKGEALTTYRVRVPAQ